MRVVIAGGSGHVGRVLSRALTRDGHCVVVLTRGRPTQATDDPGITAVAWDGCTLGPWAETLDRADVLVNLAGHTVNCRYTRRNRERIFRSRIDSTRVLGEAVERCAEPPATWLQSSTATIYAHRFDAPNDERSGILGGAEPGAPDTWRFSIDVATAWERTFDACRAPRTRKIAMRSAMIMSPERGGIFDTLLGLVRRGLGGTPGDGRQFVSWIHYEDFVRALYWLLAHQELAGPINLAAPEPLPFASFMRALRAAWGTRIGLPSTRAMLEVGAWVLRTETELVLKSRRVVPGILLRDGFSFESPRWPEAARRLCDEWRELHGSGRPRCPIGPPRAVAASRG